MSSCEHCWSESALYDGDRVAQYSRQLARAEREGAPCTQDTLEGRRLRAGQWWDEAAQADRRFQGNLGAAAPAWEDA